VKRVKALTLPLVALLSAGTLISMARPAPADTFVIGQSDFLLNDKPFVIRCGEMHFSRVPVEYWQHRLKMAKSV
jgi:beta-galactosidase